MHKYQFSSVTQPCLILCHPVDYSKPDFPVHHQLQQLTETHVHQVGDAHQPSHSLLPISPVFSLSHQVAKVLKLQFQHQSFQLIFRTDFLVDGLVGSPKQSKGSSPTPQLKSICSSALSFLYGPTLIPIHDYWKNQCFD